MVRRASTACGWALRSDRAGAGNDTEPPSAARSADHLLRCRTAGSRHRIDQGAVFLVRPSRGTLGDGSSTLLGLRLTRYLTTRDGKRLRYSVLLPKGKGPFPTVINYSGHDPGAIGSDAYLLRCGRVRRYSTVVERRGWPSPVRLNMSARQFRQNCRQSGIGTGNVDRPRVIHAGERRFCAPSRSLKIIL